MILEVSLVIMESNVKALKELLAIFNWFYVLIDMLFLKRTHQQTHSPAYIILLLFWFFLRHLLIWGKLTLPRQDEGGRKAISTPEKDKGCVGGPGVLCKNPKVDQAWILTPADIIMSVDTEGQRYWKR